MAPPKFLIPQSHPPHSKHHTLTPTIQPSPLHRRPRRKDDILTPSVSTDINAAQQRHSELLQIANLLILAHHRNKNQHRRSRWWKELGMLRRNLKRAVLLVGGDEDGKKKNLTKKSGGTAGRREGDDVEKILGFVRSRLIPRCWVAFSGLVADTQYAGLGLMLLGTLGRLAGVVGWEEYDDDEVQEEEGHVDVDDMVGLGGKQEEEVAIHHSGGIGLSGEDLGVPLVREEVVGAEEVQMTEYEKHTMEEETVVVPAETKRKGKKKHRDAIDELFSGLI